MNRLSQIRAKRARLLARAAVERERVAVQMRAWEAPLAFADKGLRAVRYVRRHPEWILAAAALLVVLRPRRAIAWARRGIAVWRTWRWMSASMRNISAERPA